ncbi:Isonitrile hydratase [Cladobotryum mycophilum]|uniref:Isonitrile hydratase n=1 Tax=Cladobotryum mycophilum TaxID=491253 RepID=A0ABR0SRJ0_9HYPO
MTLHYKPSLIWRTFLFFLLAVVHSQPTAEQTFNARRTLSLGIVVFPGFEPLDVFGPLEIFYSLSSRYKITLSVIAKEPGQVSAGIPPYRAQDGGPIEDFGYILRPTVYATHSFDSAPALDVLLVPGGTGTMAMDQVNDTSASDFVAARVDRVDYLLSVCTGAVILANAGVLSGRRATSNKAVWPWIVTHGKNVTWVPTARWVQDGNIWTSSGVAAGMDMTYALLAHLYGEEDDGLVSAINGIEYAPHTNASWDPFSVVHKVPGANPNADVADCVRPVGF